MSTNIKQYLMLIRRGIGYALPSLLMLISSLIINKITNIYFIIYSIGLICMSLPFFFLYAYIYHYDFNKDLDIGIQKLIYILLCIISFLICLVLFVISRYQVMNSTNWIVLSIAYFIINISLNSTYYHYAYTGNPKNNEKYKIRFWLIVPVIFSITLSFNIPFSIKAIGNDSFLVSLIPYISFLLYLLTLQIFLKKSKKRTYCFFSFAVLIILVLIYTFISTKTQYNILLSITLSAFMASFEATRITAYKFNNSDITTSLRENSYYKATALSIIISFVAIPSLLISTPFYSFIFYILVTIFGITSCFIWFYVGTRNTTLSAKGWTIWKNIAGFFMLIFSIADAVVVSLPHILKTKYFFFPAALDKDIFKISSLFTLIGVFIWLIKSIYSDYHIYQRQIINNPDPFKQYNSSWKKFIYIIKNMSNEPINYNRLLGILSFIPFIIIFIYDVSNPNMDEKILIRIRGAELIYFITSCICIIFDIFCKIFSFNKKELPMPKDISEDLKQNVSEEKCTFSNKIMGIAKLTRIITCSFIELIVFIPLLENTQKVLYSFLSGLPFMFSAMAGFAINDIIDYKKDKINKPNRTLPKGLLNVNEAKVVFAFIMLINIVLIFFVSNSVIDVALYISALIGVLIYNVVVKYIGIAKTICTAFLCVLPILFVTHITNNCTLALPISSMAFLYIIGREIRMDILDVKGDKIENIKTLPIIYGKKIANTISQIILYSTILLTCTLITINIKSPYGIIVSLCILISQIYCEILWNKNNKKKSIVCQWIPMLISFFTFINI